MIHIVKKRPWLLDAAASMVMALQTSHSASHKPANPPYWLSCEADQQTVNIAPPIKPS